MFEESENTAKAGLYPILGLSLLGMAIILYATSPWGVGVNPDTPSFVRAGRSLWTGHGYRLETAPLLFWPPLYPALVGLSSVMAIDPYEWSRWLGALSFGGTLLAMGLLLRWCAGPAAGWAAAGTFLLATSKGLLSVFSFVLTESLFLLLVAVTVLLLAQALERGRLRRLMAASGTAALAFLTRYPGLFFIASSALAILVLYPGERRRRAMAAGLFTGIAVTPGALWLLGNHLAGGSSTGRQMAYHPMTAWEYVETAHATVMPWFVPWALPLKLSLAALAVIGIALGALLWRAWRRMRLPDEGRRRARIAFVVLGLFVAVYAAMLLFSKTFMDAWTFLDERILSPVFLCGLALAVCAAATEWVPTGNARARRVLWVCAVVLAAAYLGRGALWVSDARTNGLGLGSRAWRQSEVVQQVRALPPGTLVFANATSPLLYLTDQPIRAIPRKINPISRLPNPDHRAIVLAMCERLSREGGVLVYFNRCDGGPLPVEEIAPLVSLDLVTRCRDGAIYRLAGAPAP